MPSTCFCSLSCLTWTGSWMQPELEDWPTTTNNSKSAPCCMSKSVMSHDATRIPAIECNFCGGSNPNIGAHQGRSAAFRDKLTYAETGSANVRCPDGMKRPAQAIGNPTLPLSSGSPSGCNLDCLFGRPRPVVLASGESQPNAGF